MMRISFTLIFLIALGVLVVVLVLIRLFRDRAQKREPLDGDEINQTLTHCSVCGYWLRGLPDRGRCPECGSDYDKYWGVWRSGAVLVMSKKAELPGRCIKCNVPVEQYRLKRKFHYHHPAWYLLILLNLLIYIIVAMLVTKSAVIHVPLCPRHCKRRWMWIGVTWFVFLSSLGIFALAIGEESGIWGLAGVGVLLLSLILLAVAVPVVRPGKIDSEFAWIKGVCPEYLAQLSILQHPPL